MNTFYKATRPDGTDFYSGTIDYAAALVSGERVRVPYNGGRKGPRVCCTELVLHASTVPAETLIGGSWPCRLFEVTGRPIATDRHKRGFVSLRVVREIDAWQALGPNGEAVAALIERAKVLTPDEAERLAAALDAAWGAARGAALDAAWDAARGAAWDAARGAARGAAWGAARALVVRDLLAPHHYQTLTQPWATVIGPAHPDDNRATQQGGA